jgi:hypothetical protein
MQKMLNMPRRSGAAVADPHFVVATDYLRLAALTTVTQVKQDAFERFRHGEIKTSRNGHTHKYYWPVRSNVANMSGPAGWSQAFRPARLSLFKMSAEVAPGHAVLGAHLTLD